MDDRINFLEQIRTVRPIVHLFPDPVSNFDCASVLNALGAVPVFAESSSEASEIARGSQALCLNLTAPTSHRCMAMSLACMAAFEKGSPCVLNASGVHFSRMRMRVLHSLLDTGTTVLLCSPDLFGAASRGFSEDGALRRTAEKGDVVERARRLAMRNRTTIVMPFDGFLIVSAGRAALLRCGNSFFSSSASSWGIASVALAAGLAACRGRRDDFDSMIAALSLLGTCADASTRRLESANEPFAFRQEFFRSLNRASEWASSPCPSVEFI